METWSFYSAGIRIARFWPAAGTLEWACLDDGAGVLGARGAMNEENAEWFARRYQFSPAAFFAYRPYSAPVTGVLSSAAVFVSSRLARPGIRIAEPAEYFDWNWIASLLAKPLL